MFVNRIDALPPMFYQDGHIYAAALPLRDCFKQFARERYVPLETEPTRQYNSGLIAAVIICKKLHALRKHKPRKTLESIKQPV